MAEYCNDHFKMVEDTDDSFRMWQGLVGPCYTPVLSNDGTLSWTNNANLQNPEAVNIRGPQGAGIRIAGIVDSVESLPASAADGAIWLVGEGSPYEGYAWISSGWIDLGPLTVGPAGPPGPQGDDYELTEADKQEIAEISESILLTELDSEPLGVRYGGTGARTVEGAKQMLGIDEITDKLGTWPLGTDAQDVAGAINEMIGEIDLQVADIEQLKNNFAGEFSPTSTYTVGTYVVYDGAFWRCTTAVTTAGSWTGASNWTQVTAGGEFVDVRGIIGTSPLNTTAQTLTGAINEHETDISALDTALNGKVSKTGDTMTGDLLLSDASAIVVDSRITSGTAPSSNIYGKSVYLNDSARFNVGTWQIMSLVNGREGFQLVAGKKVNNVNKFNYIRMLVDANGDPVVELNGAAAWLSALGLGTNGALPITIAQGGTGQTAVAGTGTLSQIATAATGFTFSASYFAQWGKIGLFRIGIAKNVAWSGNQNPGTVVSGKRTITQCALVCYTNPNITGFLDPNGTITINSPTTINANTVHYFYAIYLLA